MDSGKRARACRLLRPEGQRCALLVASGARSQARFVGEEACIFRPGALDSGLRKQQRGSRQARARLHTDPFLSSVFIDVYLCPQNTWPQGQAPLLKLTGSISRASH